MYGQTKNFRRYLKRVAKSLSWPAKTEFYVSIKALLGKEAK
jgi:hypothetical protein